MTDEQMIKVIKEVNGIEGMTVNERLYVCGLINEFENANIDKAKRILELILVDQLSIENILNNRLNR